LEAASVLTVEAQNALLKTLEEPPEEALLLLGAKSESDLLPTILSRCQIIHLPTVSTYPTPGVGYVHTVNKDMERLLSSTKQERFEYIEKLKERKEFLQAMLVFFRTELHAPRQCLGGYDYKVVNFLRELLQAEEWATQNVNIRAILEYLMLVMPTSSL
jgi:hypothetical protein